jgi:hypothetical protein
MVINIEKLRDTILGLIDKYIDEKNRYIMPQYMQFYELAKRKFRERVEMSEVIIGKNRTGATHTMMLITVKQNDKGEYTIYKKEEEELRDIIHGILATITHRVFDYTIILFDIILGGEPLEATKKKSIFQLKIQYQIGIKKDGIINQANS